MKVRPWVHIAKQMQVRWAGFRLPTEIEAEGGTVGEGTSDVGWELAAQLTRSLPQRYKGQI